MLQSAAGEARCATHVTLAYNLWDGSGNEGGITPLPKPTPREELLGGHSSLTDHMGLNAEVDLDAPHCSPSRALLAPELTSTEQGVGRLKLPYRGAVHWIRIDQPGTYSFSVNPVNQLVPWQQSTFNNGLTYRVYQAADLSRPLSPYKGEVITVLPVTLCDDECEEIPGFTEPKFHVAEPPFYVKVFHPSREYPEWWHGEYMFLYKRLQCTTAEEACGVDPFQSTVLVEANEPEDPADDVTELIDGPPYTLRANAAGASPSMWFSIYVDDPDGQTPQDVLIAATEHNAQGQPSRLDRIEMFQSDGVTPIEDPSGQPLARMMPTKQDFQDRWVWEIPASDGLLDFTSNTSPGTTAKYLVKVTRKPPADSSDDLSFWLTWETSLTWLYGPALGGESMRLACHNNTDDFSDDEIYMQIVADDERYPLGAQSGVSEDGVDLDLSVDENEDELPDWTDKVIPALGFNSNGDSFAAQKGIKYVASIEIELIEDDAFLTAGDDVSTRQTSALGKVSGGGSFMSMNFFGEDYRQRGGSVSHAQPARPCGQEPGGGGCAAPLVCINGVCRQPLVQP